MAIRNIYRAPELLRRQGFLMWMNMALEDWFWLCALHRKAPALRSSG
jgi:hypothetical protein